MEAPVSNCREHQGKWGRLWTKHAIHRICGKKCANACQRSGKKCNKGHIKGLFEQMLTKGKGTLGYSVFVNGRSVETTAANLSDLVTAQELAGARIATALNGQFIPEARRATTTLKPGDRIEIVSPRQGG